MGIIKTKGLIISESKMGDFDKMVTILTPSGKIGCAAKGARRPKSLLMAGTQFFCFGEYLIFKGNSSYSINSCDTIEIFYNLRTDLDKLNYAVELCKIVDSVTYENQNTYKILQLLLNTLYVISETDKDLELVASIFRIRLLCLLGFMPKVDKCVTCGNNDSIAFFSIADDGFKCKDCGKVDKSALGMCATTVDAVRYIIYASSKKIFSFDLSEEQIREISLVSKIYLEEKLSRIKRQCIIKKERNKYMNSNKRKQIENETKKIVNSFKYAIDGIFTSLKYERNMKIHIVIMILVIIAGFFLKISILEWIVCIVLFAGVISGELFNTAIENLVDIVMPYKNEKAKVVKDVSAGAVLIWAIGAAIIGLIIFIPKIIRLF